VADEAEDLRDEHGDLVACDCGGALTFDPAAEGETCGGLLRAGANVCGACGKLWLSRRGHTVDTWRLNKGGRSVDAGGTRIRCEATPNAPALMARIARLPELERALRAIAAGMPVTLARCGRYVGDNDATTPQLTCIRWRHHGGACDNVRGDGVPDAAAVARAALEGP
jgi:hypothetical protein